LCIRKSPVKNILGHVKKSTWGYRKEGRKSFLYIGRKKIQTNKIWKIYCSLKGKSSDVGQKSDLICSGLLPYFPESATAPCRGWGMSKPHVVLKFREGEMISSRGSLIEAKISLFQCPEQ